MVKGLLTVSWLLLLLSISNVRPYMAAAGAAENSQKAAIRVVNINVATEEEIAAIPGIGGKKSQAIVEFRRKNGPFEKAEDLKKVDGIGDKLFEKIRPYVVVKGETTLKPSQK